MTWNPEEEVFLNQFIDYDPFSLHVTRLGTYIIFNSDQTFQKLIKDEKKYDDPSNNHLWILYFDGAVCKFNSDVGV